MVPKNLLPGSFALAAYNSSYLPFSTYLSVSKDMTIDIQLSRGKTVSGAVRDSGEKALANVRVRAFQGGNLVNSALSDSAGCPVHQAWMSPGAGTSGPSGFTSIAASTIWLPMRRVASRSEFPR